MWPRVNLLSWSHRNVHFILDQKSIFFFCIPCPFDEYLRLEMAGTRPHTPTPHFYIHGDIMNQPGQSSLDSKTKDSYPFKYNLSGNYFLSSNITYNMKSTCFSYSIYFMRKLFKTKIKSMTLLVFT